LWLTPEIVLRNTIQFRIKQQLKEFYALRSISILTFANIKAHFYEFPQPKPRPTTILRDFDTDEIPQRTQLRSIYGRRCKTLQCPSV